MAAEVMKLSDVGLQAINNADAGGQLVKVTSFKIGDSGLSPNKEDFTDLLGATLFTGGLHHVEVLNKQTARFQFEVPGYSIEEDTEIKEICVFMENNTCLGRCVFSEPYILQAGETVRFNCLLVTSRCDLTAIDITIGDYSSVPSTPNVYRLQSPAESSFNLVTVLDGTTNADGSSSPILAMRSGAGAFQWAFSDHSRIFFGEPDSATTDTVTISGLELDENEAVIIHIVSGSGQGETRRFRYQNDAFVEADGKPFSAFDSQSTVAVWRRISGAGAPGGACSYPPNMEGIPHDWVLTRGRDACPKWAPPKGAGSTSATLYREPSRLVMNAISQTGSGDVSRYSLGAQDVDNVNYIQPILGGVSQMRSAFDYSGNELEFVEDIPVGLPIELRTFTRVPSNGTRLVVAVDLFVGDGSTKKFKLSQPVESAFYVKASVRGIHQHITSFSYDAATQELEFVAAIPTGAELELRSFRMVDAEGYSTVVTTNAFRTRSDTLFIELPITPQSAEYVEINQSGSRIHHNMYTLVDNKIILTGPIRRDLEVEVTIYDNVQSVGSPNTNLKGVVIDAVLAGRSLKLLRHGDKPVTLPIPSINLEAGSGIRITGQHPFYRIESTLNQQMTDAKANFKHSDMRTVQDAPEILFTHRIQLSSDVQVTVHADFSANLGPGFQTLEGLEIMEYVVGFRTSKSREPEYGRQIAGTGVAGFSSLAGDKNERAFSNASLTQVYDVIASNHPSGYIDIVIKMRVRNSNIGQYGSLLGINANIIGTPRIASNA